MTAPNSNRELVDRARGDRTAFEQLFAEHSDRVEYYVRLRLGEHLRRRLEVDDVVQEVALRACRSVERFEWNGERSFLRWLKGVAEHVILETASRDQRSRTVPLADDKPEEQPSAGADLQREERFTRLQEAFEALSSDHRKVVLLARLDKLPLEVVAEKMDRTPAAVKQLLWRALHQLRANFGTTESFHLPDRRLKDEGACDGER